MSVSNLQPLSDMSKKLTLIFSGFLLLLTVAIKYFVEALILPTSSDFMDIYIPAKSGGKDYFVSQSEFATVSLIAIAVAIGFTLLIGFLVKANKSRAVVLTMIGYFIAALMYLSVILGNAFHELWGGGWSAAGVGIVVVVVFGMEILYFLKAFPRKRIDSKK